MTKSSKLLPYLAFLVFNFAAFKINAQDVEIQGKLKVTNTEIMNSSDSVVVRLADGTLAIRNRNSLGEGLDKGFFSNFEANKIIPSDGKTNVWFGHSSGISGNNAILGTPFEDLNGSKSGAAYIFNRSNNNWTEQIKLIPNDNEAGDEFGTSVSISGNYAIVGAQYDDDLGISSGAAYIFKNTGDTWTELVKLKAPDGSNNENFGISVSIDGDYAIVGTPYDDLIINNEGSAYIYKRTGDVWALQMKISATVQAANDFFGNSVDIQGDYAIVGAPYKDENANQTGAAYVFHRSGEIWVEESKLIASDGQEADYFGNSVGIFGTIAIIGAYNEDEKGGNAGAAYIFSKSGNAWSESTKLTASDGEVGDFFGAAVSIFENKAIVGAYYQDAPTADSGAGYLYVFDGNNWVEQTKLVASDGAISDWLGISLDIDQDFILIGSRYDDDNGFNSGSAYIFQTGLERGNDLGNEIQQLSRSGSNISLTKNGGTVSIDDADADSGNEFQTLSRTGSNITLSNGGGNVSVNDGDYNPINELQDWNSLPGIPPGFADGIDNVNDADSDPNNERDNLGNHTATSSLNMNSQLINNAQSLTITGSQGTSYSGAGTSMYMQLEIGHPANNSYRWYLGHQQASPSTTDDDLYFYVERGTNVANMNVAGYVQDNAAGPQMNFTGQHRSLVVGIDFNLQESEINSLEGLIVVADQNEYLSMSGGLQNGQGAIMIDESLPIVSISSKMKDKKVFGVISSLEPEKRHDAAGAFATPFPKEKGDQRMYINATGEGAIWVVDQGGSLESGDYIQTAAVPGYGMKQEDDILHNYTVAKITMDVNFEPRLVPKKRIKKAEQLVDGKTDMVNVLDNYGRIIWEPLVNQDGNPKLEYEFKVRYLKADGSEIDKQTYEQLKCEKEEVYRAAFVGCTYHCG